MATPGSWGGPPPEPPPPQPAIQGPGPGWYGPPPGAVPFHCRHCANLLPPYANACPTCGAPKGAGTNYCPTCRAPTHPAAVVCTTCGSSLKAPDAKSKLTAGLLGIFLGAFGVHRFYLGYTQIGVIQVVVTLVTCGVGSIWGLVEGVLILTGSFDKDAEGRPLTD